ncbi:NHL repeat containing protein [Thecamonas trahens ATCC 50062]|uniref:NHL repeat containing protein n=1 Tax=Thecamonas trahens ATCC 50062 TaxID=461836 RepID=A0A0L0DR79_THETB|nr:NHL repeat containing protein [Thecamonas trahens ATCC 50062]KNC53948.1 NHL repeat containing protein [Thecamonas trahens ATCC 50062]|eukprot:XP_013754151.1 NHL repeat containing protein [Thecamonas trahens ATCC 50062]
MASPGPSVATSSTASTATTAAGAAPVRYNDDGMAVYVANGEETTTAPGGGEEAGERATKRAKLNSGSSSKAVARSSGRTRRSSKKAESAALQKKRSSGKGKKQVSAKGKRRGKEEVSDDGGGSGSGSEPAPMDVVGGSTRRRRGSGLVAPKLPPPSGSVVLTSSMRRMVPSINEPPLMPSRKTALKWETSVPLVDRINFDELEVETIAGKTGRHGKRNGPAPEAEFFRCYGMVENAARTHLFVCDNGNGLVRVLHDGEVSTFAGADKSSGVVELETPRNGETTPQPLAVRFNGPTGLCIDENDTMYLVECYGNRVRSVAADGTVKVVAGPTADDKGYKNGRGSVARFNGPRGICLASDGHLYIADCDNHCIRKVEIATGKVSTFAGKGRQSGYRDGAATHARFSWPAQVIHAREPGTGESVLYVSDNHNRCVRRISLATARVTTIAGSQSQQVRDGEGTNASFESPWGMLVDAHGDLYVMEHNVNCIRKVMLSESLKNPKVVTISGSPLNKLVTLDGRGKTVSYKHPICMLDDGRGNMYISEYAGHCIRVMKGVLPVVGVEPPPPSRLLDDLASLELDEATHDVAFCVSVPHHTEISAHRSVLMARCKYFKAMFSNEFSEAQASQDAARAAVAKRAAAADRDAAAGGTSAGGSLPRAVINFPEATASALYSVIHYLYTDVLDVHEDDVLDTMKLGEFLLLERVVALCRVYLTDALSVKTAIPWLIWHSEYAMSDSVDDGDNRFIFPRARRTAFEFVVLNMIKRDEAATGTFAALQAYPKLLAELLTSAFAEDLEEAANKPRTVIASFGTTAGALAALISFLQSGELPLDTDTACEVLGLANRFSISSAIDRASRYMIDTLTPATAIERLTWVSQQLQSPKPRSRKPAYMFPNLRKTCLDFVAKNFTEISVKYFAQVQEFVQGHASLMVEVLDRQRKSATPVKSKSKSSKSNA